MLPNKFKEEAGPAMQALLRKFTSKQYRQNIIDDLFLLFSCSVAVPEAQKRQPCFEFLKF
jgi:hypothetical protein